MEKKMTIRIKQRAGAIGRRLVLPGAEGVFWYVDHRKDGVEESVSSFSARGKYGSRSASAGWSIGHKAVRRQMGQQSLGQSDDLMIEEQTGSS